MLALPDAQYVTVLADAREKVDAIFSASRVIVVLALFLGIFIVVIFLAVLAAMDVADRSHDLATLNAMGWRDCTLLGLCVSEVATRGYLALGLALVAAPLMARWILDRIGEVHHSRVPLHDETWMYLIGAGLAMLLIPLGALPAWRSARATRQNRFGHLDT
jgi:ABC-type lipoprotein release transport system permease subunit